MSGMKQVEQDFCMRQFKPAIAVLAVLVVVIVGWTLWRVCPGSFVDAGQGLTPAAAKVASGPPIDVNAKMTHPDWGNCNKCHVTTGAGKPVSKVMTGAPISIAQKATHKYWGNCVLCHVVTDGFQASGQYVAPGKVAQAAALNWLTAASLGMNAAPVTEAMMAKFNLAKEEGVLVLDVAPGSIASAAGFAAGDEIVRAGAAPTPTLDAFEAALNNAKPGSDLKFAISRGKTSRNLIASLPENLAALGGGQPAAPQAIQGVSGLVALAALSPGPSSAVAQQFESAPYFVIIDIARRSYRVEANPNAGQASRGIETGQLMANLGVGGAIAGNFGPQALSTLGSLRINAYPGVTGQVTDIF
ncbi:MAG: magnetochrome domain-containing protein, partial [Desulfovibrionaceae bacterium]|nr:magnetochrome domain-containing protein [Desulfovibrionaceae bacterium]